MHNFSYISSHVLSELHSKSTALSWHCKWLCNHIPFLFLLRSDILCTSSVPTSPKACSTSGAAAGWGIWGITAGRTLVGAARAETVIAGAVAVVTTAVGGAGGSNGAAAAPPVAALGGGARLCLAEGPPTLASPPPDTAALSVAALPIPEAAALV